MFKKNTAVNGFNIGCFIQTADGAEKTTGVPVCTRLLDGTPNFCVNTATYDSTFTAWKIDLAAADLNADLVGLVFKLSACQPISYTIRTVQDYPPTANQNALAHLTYDMTTVSGEPARCPLNAERFLRNKWVVVGGVLTVYKEDDTTVAFTATLTQSAGSNPVTGFDPA